VKRFFDIGIALTVGVVFFFLILMIVVMVWLSSPGPILHWSDRVGRNNQIFKMPKFRSMWINAPSVPTHQLENPDQWLTPIGAYLRMSSLDELPQLWCIIKGDMSLVGPRPALISQHNLIDLRTKLGVHVLVPGLTGWAQINGRDEISIFQKVKFDLEYLNKKSFFFDLKIMYLTVLKVLSRDGIVH